jgi:hypothetical protein
VLLTVKPSLSCASLAINRSLLNWKNESRAGCTLIGEADACAIVSAGTSRCASAPTPLGDAPDGPGTTPALLLEHATARLSVTSATKALKCLIVINISATFGVCFERSVVGVQLKRSMQARG